MSKTERDFDLLLSKKPTAVHIFCVRILGSSIIVISGYTVGELVHPLNVYGKHQQNNCDIFLSF